MAPNFHAVEQPYFLKKMPHNPYIGTVHDGVSTDYMKGFSVKPINWLYRFRYNNTPTGLPLGFYGRNPPGKHVHWLEVSTMEKFRLQVTCDECIPMATLSCAVILFTLYHSWRHIYYHPDLSLYYLAIWTS